MNEEIKLNERIKRNLEKIQNSESSTA